MPSIIILKYHSKTQWGLRISFGQGALQTYNDTVPAQKSLQSRKANNIQSEGKEEYSQMQTNIHLHFL